jgi:hypothetical protein
MGKRIGVIVVAVVVMAAIHLQFSKNESASFLPDAQHDVSLVVVKGIFPDAAATVRPDGEMWLNVFDVDGRLEGRIISTSPHSDHIKGHGGPTPLLIGVDPDGIIAGVYPLANMETPMFLENVISSGLLGRFAGLHISEARDLEIDAVTGATLTSDAFVDTIKHRLFTAGEVKYLSGKKNNFHFILTMALVALALAACLFPMGKGDIFRLVVLGVSLIYLGFARGQLISIQVISEWIKRGVVTSSGAALFVIAVITIAVSIFKGKAFYCYYLCPFGALQEFAGKISPWKTCLSPGIARVLGKIRHALLILIAVLLLAGFAGDLTEFEPFTIFSFRSASVTVVVLAGVSLFMSLFVSRPWCNFMCPTGALLELFRKK